MLRQVWKHPNTGSQPQENAVLVYGLPELLQHQNRNVHGKLQDSTPQVGLCHLPLPDEPQVGFQYEAEAGYQGVSAYGVVHVAPDSEAWADEGNGEFAGPVEVDESYFGGRRRNMSNSRRKALADTGRGPVGKTAVVGIRDRATKQVRAKVTKRVDSENLQGFVVENTKPGATVYTDEATAYDGLAGSP